MPSFRWASRLSSVFGLAQKLLVPALGRLFHALNAPLEHLHIRHYQLEVYDFNVSRRVAAALDVDDIRVVEAPYHMYDGVGAANVLQKLISEPLALARALYQPGYVDELDGRRRVLLGRIELREEIEPLVRHGHDAHVGLYGAEG